MSLADRTDDELLAATWQDDREVARRAGGCGLAALTALGAPFAAWMLGVTPAVGLGAVAGVAFLYGIGPVYSPPMAELRLRWGQGRLRDYQREARTEVDTEGGPDWVLVLQGRSLPSGGYRFVRLVLSAPDTARLEVRISPFPATLRQEAGDGPPPSPLQRFRAELGPEEATALLQHLERHAAESLDASLFTVADGFPAELVGVGRGGLTLTARANLAGVPTEALSHPNLLLMRRLVALAAETTLSQGGNF